MSALLRIMRAADSPAETFVLSEELPTTIGRAPGNSIVLDDLQVSGTHCRVEFQAGVWRVNDLGSTNGTIVNNARTRGTTLRDDDVIKLGDVLLCFRNVTDEWTEVDEANDDSEAVPCIILDGDTVDGATAEQLERTAVVGLDPGTLPSPNNDTHNGHGPVSTGEVVYCPKCGAELRLPTHELGKPIRCGACHRDFVPPEQHWDRPRLPTPAS